MRTEAGAMAGQGSGAEDHCLPSFMGVLSHIPEALGSFQTSAR